MEKTKELEIYETGQVQELIGYIPTSLQKWGVYIIALFITILLTGSYFFQYPETLKGGIVIPCSDDSSTVKGTLFLPPTNVGEIKEGAKVHVFSEIYPEAKYGFLIGKVGYINGIPDAAGRYKVEVIFPKGLLTTRGFKLSSRLQLTGSGEIILKESRLIEILIKPIQLISNLTN